MITGNIILWKSHKRNLYSPVSKLTPKSITGCVSTHSTKSSGERKIFKKKTVHNLLGSLLKSVALWSPKKNIKLHGIYY